jgi:hypothetical protein
VKDNFDKSKDALRHFLLAMMLFCCSLLLINAAFSWIMLADEYDCSTETSSAQPDCSTSTPKAKHKSHKSTKEDTDSSATVDEDTDDSNDSNTDIFDFGYDTDDDDLEDSMSNFFYYWYKQNADGSVESGSSADDKTESDSQGAATSFFNGSYDLGGEVY